MNWTRRSVLAALGATALVGFAVPGVTMEQSVPAVTCGLEYLENLGKPGVLDPKVAYIPPSRIDPAYTHVIYVNTAIRTEGGQKMWVIERAGSGWQLALWDQEFWVEQGITGTPPYSWPV